MANEKLTYQSNQHDPPCLHACNLRVSAILEFLRVEKFGCDGVAVENASFEGVDSLFQVSPPIQVLKDHGRVTLNADS